MSRLRFRVLQVGDPADPLLFPVYEEEQGLFVHDYNRAYRIAGADLACARVEDLPEWIRAPGGARLLPVRTVSGAESTLWSKMLDSIRAIREELHSRPTAAAQRDAAA